MGMGSLCGSGGLFFDVIVAGMFCSFLVKCGNFVVEEVVTRGESVAVPIKGVEGSWSTFPDSGISRFGRVSGGK